MRNDQTYQQAHQANPLQDSRLVDLSSLSLIVVVCAILSLTSLKSAHAHGEAVLCDATLDLVEQCGEEHDCVTNPEVSETIGYCKAETEDISFTICDRSAEVSICESGEVCKIGTIDPNIGACAEVVEEPVEDEDDHDHDHEHGDHEHGDHSDHGDHDDHDHGCDASSRPSSSLLFGLMIWGALIGRRQVTRRGHKTSK